MFTLLGVLKMRKEHDTESDPEDDFLGVVLVVKMLPFVWPRETDPKFEFLGDRLFRKMSHVLGNT